VDPATFRRDAWLRSSGYHLATWSLAGFAIELRRATRAEDAAPGFVILIAALALLTSLTHERRVGKIAGIAGEPAWRHSAQLWRAMVCLLVAGSLAVMLASRQHLLFQVWMLVVGSGCVLWGRGTRFAWMSGAGGTMIAAGLLDLAWPSTALRLFVLGLVLPAAGLTASSRYLWSRPPRVSPG
jgi:hypothetical protein